MIDDDLADTVGADAGRAGLLDHIITNVGRPEDGASDDDLDRWWGLVEVDRLASGLTLTAIARLAEPDDASDPAGPWIETSDEDGSEPTRLTAAGREAIRRLRATKDGVEV